MAIICLSHTEETTFRDVAGEEEKHALIQYKWWNYHYSNIDSHHNDSVVPCEWEEIVCNELGSITQIWRPSIPPQQPRLVDLNFTAFPNLERLGLYGMGLVGSIPTQIETLRNLTHLYFFDNNLTGTIPTQIGSLGSLIHLNLSYNKLTGESQAFLPHLLINFSPLELMDLSGNKDLVKPFFQLWVL
ncbi:LRR receptor-like serine/threonine-protein kinase RGI1 [Prosopis cineraria]|uniref:LRR receptor-like serine/threonine-protein kinase RGI1 n=1 Tax=Prosopis cineraria TaxID=364024 RepID=UPI00240FA216|nr:LRR receptor-like serine/threonine-protein kinase RGI1 [Prosopis cineraria]